MKRIHLASPHMGGTEQRYIAEAFEKNWIAPAGENIAKFEQSIEHYVDVAGAVATNTGTAAIHLALKLLGIQEGDTVFCSSLTFVASANPIMYEKAIPVFIDSERETWNLCPDALERALQLAKRHQRMPKAVIVVHLYGMPAKMDAIKHLCTVYNVPIIEDAAESLGSTYNDVATGTLGTYGIYSFNGNKIITTSGGGILTTTDQAQKDKAIYLATQAKENRPYYEHEQIGFNYRMSNISAGIGRGQMEVLDQRIAQKRAIYKRYASDFQSEFTFQQEAAGMFSNNWLTAVQTRACDVMSMMDFLNAHQIESRRVWKPMHRQPLFKQHAYIQRDDAISVSDELFARGLCLPSDTKMTIEEQAYVTDKLQQALKRFYEVERR